MDFAYHRGLSPLVSVILALGFIEAVVVHIVAMAYWGWKVALVLGLLDLAALVALLRLLRSFRRAPITLENGVLTMRTGYLRRIPIEIGNIAGFREHWTRDQLTAPGVLNMALIAWPNVGLELRRPVKWRRKTIAMVAHCVDEPVAFRRAVVGAMEASSPAE